MSIPHQYLIDLMFDSKFIREYRPYTSGNFCIFGDDLKIIGFLLDIIFKWELDQNTCPIVTTSLENMAASTGISPVDSIPESIKKLKKSKINFSRQYKSQSSATIIDVIDFSVFGESSNELILALPEPVLYCFKQ